MIKIRIPLKILADRLTSKPIDANTMLTACVKMYRYVPSAYSNYINDVVTSVYNTINYSDVDTITASNNIGAYLNESILLTSILRNHKCITNMLLTEHDGFISTAVFDEISGDSAVFNVTT